MKVLMLWKYYPEYLKYFYNKYKKVSGFPFSKHQQCIFNDHFGWPADFAEYMKSRGIKSMFIISNAELLQKQWALENDFKNFTSESWEVSIAIEQIRQFQPDILWIPNPKNDTINYLSGAEGYYKKLFFFLGHKVPKIQIINKADILIAPNPKRILNRHQSLSNIYPMRIGFNGDILKKIDKRDKKQDIVFIGGITPHHIIRAEVLAYLIENGININIYGKIPSLSLLSKIRSSGAYLIKKRNYKGALSILRPSETLTQFRKNINTIKTVYQYPVYGIDYYKKLSESRVGLNIHIDISENYSGNIRMFETTGVGTCLLTDDKMTNNNLFNEGKEILIFRSKEQLLEKLKEFMQKKHEITKIAKAGQSRTLQEYTMGKMFNDIQFLFN